MLRSSRRREGAKRNAEKGARGMLDVTIRGSSDRRFRKEPIVADYLAISRGERIQRHSLRSREINRGSCRIVWTASRNATLMACF